MPTPGEVDAADAGTREGMRRALREAVARSGGARRISGLSLMAVLCASAVAPVALVGPEIGPVLAAWLGTVGAVGSNLLADVVTNVAGRGEKVRGRTGPELERAVAAELELRMAAPGRAAAMLRDEVARYLREHGAQQMLVDALAEGDSDVRDVLAEAMVLLLGRFGEFAELLGAVHEGVGELLVVALGQQIENEAQEQHRRQVQTALTQILRLLEVGSASPGGASPGGAGVVLNTLPPDTASFTGRDEEIAEIVGRVEAAAAYGGVVAIHAIGGMPGVGKTALAVHVAHRLAARFPDQQLFVDLHAHTAERAPADPAATLASLLAGDGVDPQQLPAGLEELSALWRARTAARRALVVLDNAADSAQVTPLLPGGRECLVLITSRRHIGDLPYAVADISLDVLAPDEAVAMFLRLCPRAAGQEEQVARVVELAGYLPLAVALLARVYARHRAWSISDLLRETGARLLTMTAENHTIAAAFDLSYRTLAPARQRFFRLLSLHPGTDLDPYAAGALTDTTPDAATVHLEALYGDHLLTELGYHRYGMHDLIHTYARDLTHTTDPDKQCDTALDRLLHFYAHTAHTATALIGRYPRSDSVVPAPAHAPALPDAEAARTWLRTEHPNLDAAHAHAHTHHLHEHTVNLAAGMAEILITDGPWIRALDIHQAAADAATRLNEPAAHAAAVNDLGQTRHMTGDFPAAADAHTRALEVFRRIGDQLGEANALTGLGRVRYLTGDLPGAADAHAQALEIFRRIGNRLGEAAALNVLGRVQAQLADFRAAGDALGRALRIYRELGNHNGEAEALNNNGRVLALLADYPAAASAQAGALEIFRRVGNRNGEAAALNNLGQVLTQTGDFPAAADAHTRALEIFRLIGNRLGEATALNYLGQVRAQTGDFQAAADALAGALEIFRRVGNRNGEAAALNNLGKVWAQTGDFPAAADAHSQAVEIYRRTGNRGNESWALNYYAAAIAGGGDCPRALKLYQQALAMNRELNKADDEAISLEGIANHYLDTGDIAQGIEYLRQALEIFQRLGMRADIERVQARLAEFGEE